MTRDPSGSSAKHQVKDVLFFVCVCPPTLKKKVSVSACGSLAVLFLLEFLSGWPEVSRRDNMDYHDISLTLPLRLSAPWVTSCSWGAVSWNQVSHFDHWRVTLLLLPRRLLRNVPSRLFIPGPACPSSPHPLVPPAITKAEGEFTAERIIHKLFCRWRRSLIWNHLRRITVVFTRKVRAHSTLNPPSPCLAISPQICGTQPILRLSGALHTYANYKLGMMHFSVIIM